MQEACVTLPSSTLCPYVSILTLLHVILMLTEAHRFMGSLWVTHRFGGSWMIMHFFGHPVLVFNLLLRYQREKKII